MVSMSRACAGFGQRKGLRGERSGDFLAPNLAIHEQLAGGPDRREHQCLAGRRALGDFHPGVIDGVELAGQSGLRERDPVGTERVGQNHLASGFHVGAGYGFHSLGALQVPGIG